MTKERVLKALQESGLSSRVHTLWEQVIDIPASDKRWGYVEEYDIVRTCAKVFDVTLPAMAKRPATDQKARFEKMLENALENHKNIDTAYPNLVASSLEHIAELRAKIEKM